MIKPGQVYEDGYSRKPCAQDTPERVRVIRWMPPIGAEEGGWLIRSLPPCDDEGTVSPRWFELAQVRLIEEVTA